MRAWLLLACLVPIPHAQGHGGEPPAPATVDLSGTWRLSAPDLGTIAVEVPSRAPGSAGNRFTLERDFDWPGDTGGSRTGFLVGTAATFLDVFINGTQLSPVGRPTGAFVEPPENCPRLFLIPPGTLAAQGPNTITVEVERTYGGAGGILRGPVLIGPEPAVRLAEAQLAHPYLVMEAAAFAVLVFGAFLMGLLRIRSGPDPSLGGFLLLSGLVLAAIAAESHWVHRAGWKEPWLVKLGWCSFGLVLPATLVFLHRFFEASAGVLSMSLLWAACLVTALILLLPDPSLLAIPFAVVTGFALVQVVVLAIGRLRQGRNEATPVVVGLAGFLAFALFGMFEILGITKLPFPPLPQKGIFFFEAGLLVLYFSFLLALCNRFIRSREEVRSLVRESLDAHDLERARIGRDLHDQLGQTLQGTLLHMRSPGSDPARSLEVAREQVRAAIGELRAVSHDLHPPSLEVLPLGRAIESFLEERRDSLPFRVTADIRFGGRLARQAERHLFNTFREALNNAARHAEAKEVVVSLVERKGKLILAVQDDGVARWPLPEKPGLGMKTMRERIESLGGHLSLRTRHGGGLEVVGAVPLAPNSVPSEGD